MGGGVKNGRHSCPPGKPVEGTGAALIWKWLLENWMEIFWNSEFKI